MWGLDIYCSLVWLEWQIFNMCVGNIFSDALFGPNQSGTQTDSLKMFTVSLKFSSTQKFLSSFFSFSDIHNFISHWVWFAAFTALTSLPFFYLFPPFELSRVLSKSVISQALCPSQPCFWFRLNLHLNSSGFSQATHCMKSVSTVRSSVKGSLVGPWLHPWQS